MIKLYDKFRGWLNKEINVDDQVHTRKKIITSWTSYLFFTALFVTMWTFFLMKKQYFMMLLISPITIIMLIIPFQRTSIQDKIMYQLMKRR